jgi:hypothetical protein
MVRRPPPQATCLNSPSYLVKNIYFLVSPMLEVTNDLLVSHIHLSQQAGWCHPGRNSSPCAIQHACKGHADAVSPRLADKLFGRYSYCGRISQPLTYLQVPAILHLQASAMATGLEVSVIVSKNTSILFTMRRT